MNKIAIICPYFGNFPNYFDFTIKSMENNSFIDWYIFTDNDISGKIKNENIKYIKYSFKELQELVKLKIGTSINLPYKLCDYKPTYGYLFSEYIREYSYWGYCDFDVIFGDLSKYLQLDKLEKYDKYYQLGHLTILKNNHKINEMFKGFENDVPYKKILNLNYNYIFDETTNMKNHYEINNILEKNGFKVYYNKTEFADINKKYKNLYPLCENRKRGNYFELIDGHLYMFNLYDSRIKREFSYIHLQAKKDLRVEVQEERYVITPKGFFDKSKLSKKMFYTLFDFKLFWYLNYRIKRKIIKFSACSNKI